jgi:periplasmic protein CpxP/Spy
MQKLKFLTLAIAFSIFPVGAYATQGDSHHNSQELKSTNAPQLAQHHSLDGKRHGDGERINKMLQQLELNTDQSQQIEAIKQEFKTKNEALKEQVQNNRQEMRSLLASDISTEQLRQEYQERQSLLQRLDSNRWEMMLQVREVLTSEQRGQLAELIDQERNQRRSRL